MNNAILLHGTCDREEYFDDSYPSLSNSHWFPWLQKQLQIKGISTQTPEMPEAYLPDYGKWKIEFERFSIGQNTLLVGHSCGGGFLLRWLSENKIKIGTVILVAPWLDPDRIQTKGFFDFEIDHNIINRVTKLRVFVSSDDEPDILKSTDIIRSSIPSIQIMQFENMGHFTYGDMGEFEFPELLNTILNI